MINSMPYYLIVKESTQTEVKLMTSATATVLKWHKAQHGGMWEAEYKKPWAINSFDNVTATVTIQKEDGRWFFWSSEDWETHDVGFKTLKEAKEAAQSETDGDFWCSYEEEENADDEYWEYKKLNSHK